jgi:hypothetical protein
MKRARTAPPLFTFTPRNYRVIIRRGSAIAPRQTLMHRAASPIGAGRTTTGLPPHLALETATSNRNFPRLEARVSRRKHSPAPSSNRNFRSTSFRTREAWGSQFWLRDAAHTSLNCAPTTSPTPPDSPHTPFPECGSEATAPPPDSTRARRSLANHPTTRFGARMIAATTACAAGHLPYPTLISNRSARRLEMPESYTKQRTAPLSNRHKFTQQLASSDSHLCRAQTNARLLAQ